MDLLPLELVVLIGDYAKEPRRGLPSLIFVNKWTYSLVSNPEILAGWLLRDEGKLVCQLWPHAIRSEDLIQETKLRQSQLYDSWHENSILYVTAYRKIRQLAKSLHKSYVARADWLIGPLSSRLSSASLPFAQSPFCENREGWEVIVEDYCSNGGLQFLCEFMVKLKVPFCYFLVKKEKADELYLAIPSQLKKRKYTSNNLPFTLGVNWDCEWTLFSEDFSWAVEKIPEFKIVHGCRRFIKCYYKNENEKRDSLLSGYHLLQEIRDAKELADHMVYELDGKIHQGAYHP